MDAFLHTFHQHFPGATSLAFARGRDDTGTSSYDRLLSGLSPGASVLDLCCGDGWGLTRAVALGAGACVGVDASEAELTAAAARLGARAHLHHASATALPLPDASFDRVTCHMALMLLTPLDDALSEIRRVLKPGGLLCAVVGAGRSPDPRDAWTTFVAQLSALSLPPLRLGDARARSPAALAALLPGASLTPFSLDLSGPWEAVADVLFTCYDVARLSPEARAALRDATRRALVVEGGSEKIPCSFPMLEVRWQKPG